MIDFWAGVETPDQEDERVSTWLAKLFQIQVERYLAEGEDPLAEERERGALVADEAPAQATLVLLVELDPDEVEGIARRLAPAVRHLGIEKVLVRMNLLDRDRHIDYRYPALKDMHFPGIVVGDPERHVVWGLTYRFLELFLATIGHPMPPRWSDLHKV